MERKEFLRSLGAGAAFAIVFPCVQGCSKDGNVAPEDMRPIPTGIDFTIDLNSEEGGGLQNNGDFILKNYVVVVKNLEGDFVAASQICSHQQTEEVRFVENDGGIYYCSTHGARFDQTGKPLNSITSNPLKIFQTELTGNILRIFE
ncbi:ubiquinol-cytochrome c reductase iron-sulfur subunit [Maribacter sp. Hel_I_7]|uniref:QcrA and Rieske domain-containing protein n=1 Tax=Maribacter sp. Hel_I_7 TaxID=1249997 RepID=UPI00047DDEC4|nr:Rieske 2Fe-2S domain-containing protein [Maribacter sp. Hel_I_7]|tara:strand:+ start:1466 stop:1903 length:438 start_codon:yes stop_codon:yes gene_type:complete